MDSLPSELVLHIFAYLPPAEAIAVKRLNSRIHALTSTVAFATVNLSRFLPPPPKAPYWSNSPDEFDASYFVCPESYQEALATLKYGKNLASVSWFNSNKPSKGRKLILKRSLPRSIGRAFSHAGSVFLSDNNLYGTIPSEIGLLREAIVLDFGRNALQGQIPAEFACCTKLARLALNNNNLRGAIPDEICTLVHLEELLLSGNNLSGAIPAEIGNLKKLRSLQLTNNNFSGALPDSLARLACLEELYLQNNAIEGPLPTRMGDMVALERVDVSWNRLEGDIPLSVAQLQRLRVLYVNGNNLNAPDEIVEFLDGIKFL